MNLYFRILSETTGYFLMRPQVIFCLVCGDQSRHLKPKQDVFLNLTKCFLVPNQSISTTVWWEKSFTFNIKKKMKLQHKETDIFNLSVVLQKTYFAKMSLWRLGCTALHSKIQKINKIFLFSCILTSINSSLQQEPCIYPCSPMCRHWICFVRWLMKRSAFTGNSLYPPKKGLFPQ